MFTLMDRGGDMAKGLAWIDDGRDKLGKVLVLTDSGKHEVVAAVKYAVRGIRPPIYELPVRNELEPQPIESPGVG